MSEDENLKHLEDYAYINLRSYNLEREIKEKSEKYQELLKSTDRFAFRDYLYKWLSDFDSHDFQLFIVYSLLVKAAVKEDHADKDYNFDNYVNLMYDFNIDTEGGIRIDRSTKGFNRAGEKESS